VAPLFVREYPRWPAAATTHTRLAEVTMCKIFVGADPALYETSTRSMRLHGVVTSIRLEVIFWNILGEIGRRDGMSLSQLITKLYDEIIEARGEVENFTSFLRVCCTRYLSLQLLRVIPEDVSVTIRSLDANDVLALERTAHQSAVPAV
jgi:predicted DNA-binding ribbon-helix-helix protein